MMLKASIFFFLSASCAVAADRTINDCPSNLPRDRYLRVFGDSCYSFQISVDREFAVAERQCEARHGHLLTIRNAATQQFIYNTLKNEFHQNRGPVWLGLTDAANEGHYVWVDGTAAHYTHWASGQPGLVGGLEDCAAMEMGAMGQWHDYPCQGLLFLSQNHHFVCEYPIPPATTVMPTSQVTIGNTAMPSQPVTSQPITSQPMTSQPMTSQPVTSQPVTSQPMTTAPVTAGPVTTMPLTTQGCPAFQCSLDCGLAGYQIDVSGCMVCACEGE